MRAYQLRAPSSVTSVVAAVMPWSVRPAGQRQRACVGSMSERLRGSSGVQPRCELSRHCSRLALCLNQGSLASSTRLQSVPSRRTRQGSLEGSLPCAHLLCIKRRLAHALHAQGEVQAGHAASSRAHGVNHRGRLWSSESKAEQRVSMSHADALAGWLAGFTPV